MEEGVNVLSFYCLYSSGSASMPSRTACGWCPALNRCSDGMDRNRQDWLTNNCDKNNISEPDTCHASSQVGQACHLQPYGRDV